MNLDKKIILGFFSLSMTGCQLWQGASVEKLPPTAALPQTSQQGVVEARYWNNVNGTSVSTLTTLAAYPNNPDQVESLTSLQSPSSNIGNNYGTLVRGFITPRNEGEYRFFVSGDDETQFWLSTTESELQAKQIAEVPGWTTAEEYTKYASQKSGLVNLSAGQNYYFKVLQKDGTGGDHFSVAWEGPNISKQIISSQYIASYKKPIYKADQSSAEAYSLGYRVGYLDHSQSLAFNPSYPPLDQDQDGLYDNWETVYGLDPSNPNDGSSDIDGDLLFAADEFLIGTAENNPDTDSDGIPDGVEYAYELDPLDPKDANEDFDGDGISNLDEYAAGTSIDEPDKIAPDEPRYVQGFIGQYYQGRDFNQYVSYQLEQAVDYNWGRKQPIDAIDADDFSVRWISTFIAPHESGRREYRFVTTSNDGARLFLDGQLVIDQWKDQGATSYVYDTILTADQRVPMIFEFYDNVGLAVAKLSIKDRTTGAKVPISQNTVVLDVSYPSSNIDSDGDNIPDQWEIIYGLNPNYDDATKTSNASGVTNLEAYKNSLNPWTLASTDERPDSGASPSGPVTLTWSAPTTRVNGTSLSVGEIEKYQIFYGKISTELNKSITVNGNINNAVVDGLTSGTWYFTVRSIDVNGLISNKSDIVKFDVR